MQVKQPAPKWKLRPNISTPAGSKAAVIWIFNAKHTHNKGKNLKNSNRSSNFAGILQAKSQGLTRNEEFDWIWVVNSCREQLIPLTDGFIMTLCKYCCVWRMEKKHVYTPAFITRGSSLQKLSSSISNCVTVMHEAAAAEKEHVRSAKKNFPGRRGERESLDNP